MNKKIKIGLISIVVVALLIIGFFWYSYKTVPRDLLFDMNKILGESTNNPYEIRNDVYDFIINNEVPKYKLNKEQTMLLLNIAKNNQLSLKYFDDEDITIKLYNHWRRLFHCAVINPNLSKWTNDNYSDGSSVRPYEEKLRDSSDRILILKMSEQIIINATRKDIYIKYTDDQKNVFCNKSSEMVFDLEDLNL